MEKIEFEDNFNTGFKFLFNYLQPTGRSDGKSLFQWVGAHSGAGVTTIVYYFGAFLARNLGVKVLLCDANFNTSGLTLGFELQDKPGLAELLVQHDPLENSVYDTGNPGLSLMPTGNKQLFPAITEHGATTVADSVVMLKQAFDVILLDSAPASQSPETLFLSPHMDGVVIVAMAEKTRRVVLKSTQEHLDNFGARIIGGVLNRRQYHIPNWIYSRLS